MRPWIQILLQDPRSIISVFLLWFHDIIVLIIVLVTTIIRYIFIFIINNKFQYRLLNESHNIEIIWTVIPAIVLLSMAVPSLRLLYLIDEIVNPLITIKATGHQWYWRYSYDNFPLISHDSFILNTINLNTGDMRLLEVDNRVILPVNTEIRLLVTASDVIHSWTIPSLRVKVDAIPGRLNQTSLIINKPRILYGQCSEICGANHSFIPIVIEATNLNSFIKLNNIVNNQ